MKRKIARVHRIITKNPFAYELLIRYNVNVRNNKKFIFSEKGAFLR